MGKYIVELSPLAKKELNVLNKSGNKISINNLEKTLKERSSTPYEGTGKPEALKHDLSGFWSRRVNKKTVLFIRFLKK